MWYIIYEIPGGLLIFGLVLIMALMDGAGNWVITNMDTIAVVTYIVQIIQGIIRCSRCKKTGARLWLTVPFTALSIWASTSYALLIVADIAEIATGGLLGLLGLIIGAPLALLSCVVCMAPNAFVNYMAKDGEGDEGLVIIEGIITFGLCLFCRWFFGFI